mgnify:CR=1 FL=1
MLGKTQKEYALIDGNQLLVDEAVLRLYILTVGVSKPYALELVSPLFLGTHMKPIDWRNQSPYA